ASPAPAASRPGRFAVTFKSSLCRAGGWRVPERFTTVVYKGDGVLDLRAAELTAPVTTISAVAYKSRIDILVPPGVRVETGGLGAPPGPAGRSSGRWTVPLPSLRPAPATSPRTRCHWGPWRTATWTPDGRWRRPGHPGRPGGAAPRPVRPVCRPPTPGGTAP